MNFKQLKFVLLALLLPIAANADVSSDMKNPALSLVAVMQNAMSAGASIGDAVSAMIAADKSQSSAIVATAMIVSPQDYAVIIKAAIEAGADPTTVVAAALIATDGENAAGIQAAAIAAAPDQREQIEMAGAKAIAATPLAATSSTAAGGGASVTAADVQGLRSTLAQIEADLAAAGFTDTEVADAVSTLTTALQASQGKVSTAQAALDSIAAQLVAAQQAAAEAEVLEAQLLEETAAAVAQEALADQAIDQAVAAVVAAQQAKADADAAAAGAAAAAAATAKLQAAADELAAAGDAEAAKALAAQKKAETEAELAALGETPESVQAKLDAADGALDAAIQTLATATLDLQKVEAAIAGVESGASSQGGATAAVTVAGLGLADLLTLQRNLLIEVQNANEFATDLSAQLEQLTALKISVDRLVAASAAYDLFLEGFTDAVIFAIGNLSEEDEALANLAGLAAVSAANAQAKAEADSAIATAAIGLLTDAMRNVSDTQGGLADALLRADLGALADAINDAADNLASPSST